MSSLIDDVTDQSVCIANPTGSSHFGGTPTFGAPEPAEARVEMVTRRVLDTYGNVVVSSARVWVGPEVTVLPGARVTYGGKTYHVVTVEQVADLDGSVDHIRFDLGG